MWTLSQYVTVTVMTKRFYPTTAIRDLGTIPVEFAAASKGIEESIVNVQKTSMNQRKTALCLAHCCPVMGMEGVNADSAHVTKISGESFASVMIPAVKDMMASFVEVFPEGSATVETAHATQITWAMPANAVWRPKNVRHQMERYAVVMEPVYVTNVSVKVDTNPVTSVVNAFSVRPHAKYTETAQNARHSILDQ